MNALVRLIHAIPYGSIQETYYGNLPVAVAASIAAFYASELPAPQKAGWLGFGFLTWTFLEYVLHRWLLHYGPVTQLGRAVLNRLHIFHHDDPKDEAQVCVPLVAAVPFWAMIVLALGLTTGFRGAGPLVACGIAVMMTVYDITHFTVHYRVPRSRWMKALKKHHMLHHFSDHTKRFGVTSPFWDHVFRTHR